jgi:hypothetical protein
MDSIFVRIAMLTVLAMAVVVIVFCVCGTTVFIRTLWRQRQGLCLYCGYDLRGNRSGVCPECGRVVILPPT